MCTSGFVKDGNADAVTRNAKIDIQERSFSFSDCMCELQSGMKIGDKGNVLLKVNVVTTRNAHHIVNVSLVKLRYCTRVLLTNLFFYISYKKACLFWVHFAAHGHPSHLMVEFIVEQECIQGKHQFC